MSVKPKTHKNDLFLSNRCVNLPALKPAIHWLNHILFCILLCEIPVKCAKSSQPATFITISIEKEKKNHFGAIFSNNPICPSIVSYKHHGIQALQQKQER